MFVAIATNFPRPKAKYDKIVQALSIANPNIRETIAPIVHAALKSGRYDIKKVAAIAVLMRLGSIDSIKAGPIIEAIKGTTNSDQLRALAPAFEAIAAQLKPDEARALVGPIIEAIKGTANPDQLSALAPALAAIAVQLKPAEARALAGPIIEAIKETTDFGQTGALGQALAAIAAQLKPAEARALAGPIIEAIKPESYNGIEALAALADRLSWPERLQLFASALKYPAVYGNSRDGLIDKIKKHPTAKTIRPPGDFWAVVEWLKGQPGIDLTRLPERMRAADHSTS